MRPGLLPQLPPPPSGKTGWPWTKESKSVPQTMRNGGPWPKISIVTPSYNQGQFLEETIRSVLLQNYPNLEYIIMDGGSTDNSVEIIKKYEPWLTYWVSEKDGGQADAIFRGFERTTGEIVAWINSDDYYLQAALNCVGRSFASNPSEEMLVGGGVVVDEDGNMIRKYYSFPQDYNSLLHGGQFFMQMSTFWRKNAYISSGEIDVSFKFCFDYDLFIRLASRRNPIGVAKMLSAFRYHNTSKSSTIWEAVALPEIKIIRNRYTNVSAPLDDSVCVADNTVKKFYRITRLGILMDLYKDPSYFIKCVLNKTKGKPGSTLLSPMSR